MVTKGKHGYRECCTRYRVKYIGTGLFIIHGLNMEMYSFLVLSIICSIVYMDSQNMVNMATAKQNNGVEQLSIIHGLFWYVAQNIEIYEYFEQNKEKSVDFPRDQRPEVVF